jgi:hypothetical protein
MRFYCRCLNFHIDVLETNDDQETLTRMKKMFLFILVFYFSIIELVPVDLVQYVNISHEWFLCDVPSDQSIHIAWQCLFQIIPVRDMKLYRCLGCNLFTHVTNIAPSRMLINKDLLVRLKKRKIRYYLFRFRMQQQLKICIKIQVIRK